MGKKNARNYSWGNFGQGLGVTFRDEAYAGTPWGSNTGRFSEVSKISHDYIFEILFDHSGPSFLTFHMCGVRQGRKKRSD
jgi:hypothetical protein